MSRLYHTETGSVAPAFCEELADYRRARKVLELPATAGPAQVFILARSYPGNHLPLLVAVNGRELSGIPAAWPGLYAWHELTVPSDYLVPGANSFDLWCDAPAQDAWALGLEDGYRDPQSFLSTDAGLTWHNDHMGYLNTARAEYVLRVRLAEGLDPPPPSVAWEDPSHPRLRRLRGLLPSAALRPGSTLERVRALTTWVCTRWVYRHNGMASQYAPWDPETIIAWGQAQQGHFGQLPVVMCVHYAVTLVACCQAIGIPARAGVFMGTFNGSDGHFTAEVWLEEYRKWVMVDPTTDAILFRGGVPLSVAEIQEAGDDLCLTGLVQFGPGVDFQRLNPVVAAWIPGNFLRGVCFRHRSVWARADFLSHPEFSPAGHGSVSYCETALIWDRAAAADGFTMFPYYADADYFDAPPADFPSAEHLAMHSFGGHS
jgi:hypothetical protein